MINAGQLLSDCAKREELPEISDKVEKSQLPKISQEAWLSGFQNVGRVVDCTAQLGVGQGASPRQQGDQKPWEIDLIRKCFGVEMHHNSKNKIKQKKWTKSSLTLGDFIVNNADIKKDLNISRNKGRKSEKTLNSH